MVMSGRLVEIEDATSLPRETRRRTVSLVSTAALT